MKFQQSRNEEPEINLIPLIDVLLMALIFLLVTTSFSNQSQLRLQLPEAGSQSVPEEPTVRITIDAQGQYFVNNKQLLKDSAELLMQTVSAAAGNRKDPIIIISADRKTTEPIPPELVASGEVLQTKVAIRNTVRRGRRAARELCQEVKARVATEPSLAWVDWIEVRTDRYQVAGYFTGARKPVWTRKHARCRVQRNQASDKQGATP